VTRTITVTHLCTENNRFYGLHNSNGIAIVNRIEISNVAECVFGTRCEGYSASFATVKNYILFESGYAGEYLTVPYSEACLCFDLNVITHDNLIEAFVERNLVRAYVGPKKLCLARSDTCSASEYFFGSGCNVYACILEAISVAATIKHAHCIDADCSSAVAVKT
jgi:hypothetical protein